MFVRKVRYLRKKEIQKVFSEILHSLRVEFVSKVRYLERIIKP